MRVSINVKALKEITVQDYALRFLFGGLTTLATGLMAQQFGPGIGGVFLAFPAIFPASATLLAKHVRQKKQKAGLEGETSACKAVSLDARGASLGCLGLIIFAISVWQMIPRYSAYIVLPAALIAWLITAVLSW